ERGHDGESIDAAREFDLVAQAARAHHASQAAFEQSLRQRRIAIHRARSARRVGKIAGRTQALGQALDEAAGAVEVLEVEIRAGARADQQYGLAGMLARNMLD